MALSCVAQWGTAAEDQANVARALSRSMMQRMVAGDGKGQGARPQDHAEEHEGEVTVDAHGSSCLLTRLEVFHFQLRRRSGEFDAGWDDDAKSCLRARYLRRLYSTGG